MNGEKFTVNSYDAIVNPVLGQKTAMLGPVAVMAACEPDVALLSDLLGYSSDSQQRLFISRLYCGPDRPQRAALAGPMIGAPYAAMILETLIVRGARRIIFLGWCGALSPDLSIGDLVVPTAAIVGEGTSPNYPPAVSQTVPSPVIVAEVYNMLSAEKAQARQGMIWTTDAAFRETRDLVTAYRRQGAVAVDMETSALFAVAAFRRVEIAAVLIVSDSLAGESWQPGFHAPQFKTGRKAACHLVDKLCRTLHQLP